MNIKILQQEEAQSTLQATRQQAQAEAKKQQNFRQFKTTSKDIGRSI